MAQNIFKSIGFKNNLCKNSWMEVSKKIRIIYFIRYCSQLKMTKIKSFLKKIKGKIITAN